MRPVPKKIYSQQKWNLFLMAETPLLSRLFRVGKRTVTMTIPKPNGHAICLACEWCPNLPKRLSKRERREYLAGRHAVMTELATLTAGLVTVIDV